MVGPGPHAIGRMAGVLVAVAAVTGFLAATSSIPGNSPARADSHGILTVHVDAGGDAETPFEFMLDGQFQDSLTTTEGEALGWDLAPGTYRVDENVPDGWSLVQVVCAVGSGVPEPYGVTVHVIANFKGVSDVPVLSGQETECTFSNVHASGALTVEKVVIDVDGDETGFEFRYLSEAEFGVEDFSEAGGPVTIELPLGEYMVEERYNNEPAEFPDGYHYFGYRFVVPGVRCPSAPASSDRWAAVTIDDGGDHVKICFYNATSLRPFELRLPALTRN